MSPGGSWSGIEGAQSRLAKGYCPVSLGVSVVQAMSVLSQTGHEMAATLAIPTRKHRKTRWLGFMLTYPAEQYASHRLSILLCSIDRQARSVA